MLEAVPPGQHPIMITATACIGSTSNASASTKPVRGIIPNWQRKPTRMPQGLLMCPKNFGSSTLQPMENITSASMIVRTVLKIRLRVLLESSAGSTQEVPWQTVAAAEQ